MSFRNLVLIIILLNNNSFFSQGKDSTVLLNYYILVNGPVSRNLKFDIGVERVSEIKRNLSSSSMISFTAGKFNGNFNNYTYFNPFYFSACFQPYHILIGKKLKFESGISGTFQLFRFNSKQYPVTDSFPFFNDAVNVFYMIGLRYTFLKPQLTIKLITGPRYRINLQKNESGFINSFAAELGISWRLRKKIRKNIPHLIN